MFKNNTYTIKYVTGHGKHLQGFEDSFIASSFLQYQISCDQNKEVTFEHLCLVSHPPVTQSLTKAQEKNVVEVVRVKCKSPGSCHD